MGRCFTVPGIKEHNAFPDHDLLDAPFLQQDDHVFHDPARGNDAIGGEGAETAPENDVGLDEHFSV